ncbi:DNA-directed RNA polymerase subunit delta [Paenibacillus sp. FJAT-26967]|uniref:DNA-directed RNA polymerase subunit delta n=1 Tax=Paenibacillus sp. FJAT-26967 TaxID=1729690 RepID=UPI000838BF71|nr:DNA-directed RNA polymerase subunit delta [Paenibacillus sp. FJAT-26967]
MSSPYTLKIKPDKAAEMPMVDLAFEVLKAANTPFYYRDLMHEIAKIKGLAENEMMNVIAQLYTEINIDGRFACVGTNLWGLKRWYPVEKSDDAVGNAKRPRIINDEDDDLDEDYSDEEEYKEEEYTALDADRGFDSADKEEEEEEEEEEETEFFEEEEIDEELEDGELDDSDDDSDEDSDDSEEDFEDEDKDLK